jgi:NAD(P) transhydrogenase subunit beta
MTDSMSSGTLMAYLLTSVLFIYGMMRLRSPATARSGMEIAAAGMAVAVITAFITQHDRNLALIVGAMVVGTVVGTYAARAVRMTAMPQMVALFNGMGAGAAALVAAGALVQELPTPGTLSTGPTIGAVVSVVVGSISVTGSLLAFAKLQEIMTGRPITFPHQNTLNGVLLFAVVAMGIAFVAIHALGPLLAALAVGGLLLGVLLVLPVGGGDMPVIISLLNSCTGIAAAATGFDVNNPALIIGGTLVGASGTILTILMTRAMNRPLTNVLFGAFGAVDTTIGINTPLTQGVVRSVTPEDLAASLSYAHLVIIVPGYGLAVARAQQELHEMARMLEQRGVTVKYAIHPVAGRMPGHMNVLLAEANVPYDELYEMDAINGEFERADVALVVGANDVVNPAARNDPSSPIYGMPILNVDQARTSVILKRSMSAGFAGIDNPLFYSPKNLMLFGDARQSILKLIAALKEL